MTSHIANIRYEFSPTQITLRVRLFDDRASDEFFLGGTDHEFAICRDTLKLLGDAQVGRSRVALTQALKCPKICRVIRSYKTERAAA